MRVLRRSLGQEGEKLKQAFKNVVFSPGGCEFSFSGFLVQVITNHSPIELLWSHIPSLQFDRTPGSLFMITPTATYRIQFSRSFGCQAANSVVPYLADLGISDMYASPIFRAAKGSLHGYDVVDPNQLNPELGGLSDLEALAAELRRHNMGWTTFLPLSDLVGGDTGAFAGPRVPPLIGRRP